MTGGYANCLSGTKAGNKILWSMSIWRLLMDGVGVSFDIWPREANVNVRQPHVQARVVVECK